MSYTPQVRQAKALLDSLGVSPESQGHAVNAIFNACSVGLDSQREGVPEYDYSNYQKSVLADITRLFSYLGIELNLDAKHNRHFQTLILNVSAIPRLTRYSGDIAKKEIAQIHDQEARTLASSAPADLVRSPAFQSLFKVFKVKPCEDIEDNRSLLRAVQYLRNARLEISEAQQETLRAEELMANVEVENALALPQSGSQNTFRARLQQAHGVISKMNPAMQAAMGSIAPFFALPALASVTAVPVSSYDLLTSGSRTETPSRGPVASSALERERRVRVLYYAKYYYKYKI